jgi:RNA polymerase sigma-70 factor (ECF subfamily)
MGQRGKGVLVDHSTDPCDAWADPDLIQAIGRGDTRALEQLYQRHGLALLSYLTGQVGDVALAEELLQDVMLAVWQGAAAFRGESRVTTWLLAIARRRAITARQKPRLASVPLIEDAPAAGPGPLESLVHQDEQAAIRAALDHLPLDQRETLELIFFHELSGPEAAAVLGVAPGTIKSRLNRAKTLLQRWYRLREHTP